jgi:hypothetical protein
VQQLSRKYGSEFTKNAQNNVDGVVNVRLFQKLSVQPPSAFLVVRYLEEIALEYKVDWVNTDIGLPPAPISLSGIYNDEEGNKVSGKDTSPGGGPLSSPSGFSVAMAPGYIHAFVYVDLIRKCIYIRAWTYI